MNIVQRYIALLRISSSTFMFFQCVSIDSYPSLKGRSKNTSCRCFYFRLKMPFQGGFMLKTITARIILFAVIDVKGAFLSSISEYVRMSEWAHCLQKVAITVNQWPLKEDFCQFSLDPPLLNAIFMNLRHVQIKCVRYWTAFLFGD